MQDIHLGEHIVVVALQFCKADGNECSSVRGHGDRRGTADWMFRDFRRAGSHPDRTCHVATTANGDSPPRKRYIDTLGNDDVVPGEHLAIKVIDDVEFSRDLGKLCCWFIWEVEWHDD